MTQLSFAPASRKQAKARIALEGPTGSGKTLTALITARVLGNRVAVIDTEHKTASKYAPVDTDRPRPDEFVFDALNLDRYDPKVLIDALATAAASGYDVVVIDSLSHFWMGADGMLEQVDRAAKRSAGGNSFGGWKEVTPIERRMIEAILAFPGHVIATMRQRTEWVIEENEKGKKVPRKIGLKAVQREGIEYEFDIVGDMDNENTLVVSKSRCRPLSGAVISKPDEEFGRTILAWLTEGVESGPSPIQLRDEALDKNATRDDLLALYQRAQKLGLLGAAVVDRSGDAATLGELITAQGKALAAARPGNGSAARLSEPQRMKIHALLPQAGIAKTDRDGKLQFVQAVIGRPVASTSELTFDEAGQVIAALEAAVAEPSGAEPVGAES